MKRTKKLLSFVTACCMSAALLPVMSVSADSAGDDMPNAPLGIYYNVNSWDGYSTSDFSIEYSENAKEGNYALRINNVNEVDNRQIITKVPLKKTLSSGDTYKVSFWINCTNTEGNYLLGNSSSDYTIDGLTPSAVNEWVYCEAETTLTLDATNFQIRSWKEDRCIDDLQICKKNDDGTFGENVVLNGNFETIKVPTQKTKIPASWETYYSGSNASNVTKMSGQNTFIESTDADAYSGNRSLLVNVYQELDNALFNVLTKMENGVKNGTSYRLNMYIKNIEDGPRASIGNAGGDFGWGQLYTGNATDVGDGWYKLSLDFTGDVAQSNVIRFGFWPQGAMLIDDVTLYELDSNGNAISGAENLILNGGFEEYNPIFSETVEVGKAKNWFLAKHNLPEEDNSYMKLIETENGNHALHLNYASEKAPETYYQLVNIDDQGNGPVSYSFPNSNGTYTLSFDAKGVTDDSFNFGAYWQGHVIRNSQSSDYTKTTQSDGWVHYSFTQSWNGSENGATQYPAVLVENPVDFVIDNISFKDDVTGVEYVINGNFENFVEYSNEFSNVVAYPVRTGGAVTVSWTNAHGTIEDAKLLIDGTEQDITINTESDAFNEIYIDGLTPGQKYEVEVKAKINGTDKTYTASVTPSSATGSSEMDYRISGIGDWKSDDWSSYIRDGEGYANTVVSVETEDGNNFAKIRGNIPVIKGNTYVGIEQTIQLDRGKLYKMTFKAKGEGVNVFRVIEDVTLEDGNDFWVVNDKNLTSDWDEYEIILDATNANDASLYDVFAEGEIYDARLLLMTEHYAGNVCIDDVAVYEIDPDTYEISSDNMVGNGGFDTAVTVLGDPVFTKGEETANKLTAGTFDVEVTVENAGDIVMILALYNGTKLETVSLMTKTTGVIGETYNSSLTVPDTEGEFTARVMYWDSISGMSAKRDAYVITE